ncbi:SIR2 family protein [uncultured Trichococcus sp.]|uniref:SIR2 family protein n=1 Tax=uncultured Trichococcus sp. TaxID=189665 RepID=UPI002A18B46C|nr:SIR2 family protein [uncultured Trichococcus sp.]
MDIKKMILEIVNTEQNNIRYSAVAIEKLVNTVIYDYIERQGKEVFVNHRVGDKGPHTEYDIYAPDGLDDYVGRTVFDIKMVRHRMNYRRVIDHTVGRFAIQGEGIDNLIIVLVGETSGNIKSTILHNSNLTFNLDIWDIDKLVEICKRNIDLFLNVYENLSKYIIKDAISEGIKRDIHTNAEKREKYLKQLSGEYHNDNLVLFLGAGVSRDANISTWEALISELFVALINKEMDTKDIKLTDADRDDIVASIKNQNGYSPLLQIRFLRQGFEDNLENIVREILYKRVKKTSDLLKEIVQLCVPNRGKTGIQAIINYNFDDLIEKHLENQRVKYRSIYSDGVKPNSDELGIYHVHGFLPQNKGDYENLAKSLLVFSEEGYHKLLLEPYNWANMSQLNYLTNNTCLFIGLSMTDPNLRRLLDISSQKNFDENCTHYAILKRFTINENNDNDKIITFNKINEELQESFFSELGINIIWVDNYNDIPELLNEIKK